MIGELNMIKHVSRANTPLFADTLAGLNEVVLLDKVGLRK